MTVRSKIFLLLISSFLSVSLSTADAPDSGPEWWELRIVLNTKGTYECKESPSIYSGQYAFEFLWTGVMESDGEDFIVYSEKAQLKDWEAQETALLPDGVSSRTTGDFPEEPSFDFHFILNEDQVLQLEFSITGFTVPIHNSLSKIGLNLPVTRESPDAFSTLEYNPYLRKGSNTIRLKRKSIDKTPVEKTYNWMWSFKKWLDLQETTLFFANSHEVEVKLQISPHFEKSPPHE